MSSRHWVVRNIESDGEGEKLEMVLNRARSQASSNLMLHVLESLYEKVSEVEEEERASE